MHTNKHTTGTLEWFIKFTTDTRRRQWQPRRRRWCFLLNYRHCPFIAFSPCDFVLFVCNRSTHTFTTYWWIAVAMCAHGWPNMLQIAFSSIHGISTHNNIKDNHTNKSYKCVQLYPNTINIFLFYSFVFVFWNEKKTDHSLKHMYK